MQCLLCSSNELEILESIPKKEIVRLWLDMDVNVFDEIKTPLVNKYFCKHCGLRFFDPQNAGGDKFYSELGKHDWYYLHEGKSEYEYVQQVINEGDHVLDIGSGRGELYNRITKKINYQGLELSTKAVELAAKSGINVINEDLLEHAVTHAGEYDVVCLFQVLEHLTEVPAFVNAIKACMKVGGYLCIAVPDNDGFLRYVSNNTFNLPPHHTIQWNRQSLEYLGKMFDLEVKEVYFEKLQNVHREWFINSFLIDRLRKIFNRKYRNVDFSIGYTLIMAFIEKVRRVKLFDRILKKLIFSRSRNGHSIIIRYQKPS